MSETAKIDPAQTEVQTSPNDGLSGRIFYPANNDRQIFRVDLSQLSTDLPQDLTKLPELGDNPEKDKRELDRRASLRKILPTEEEMIIAAAVFFKNASQEKTANALKAIGPEAVAALFRIAVEETGSVPQGLDVSKAAPASPSPAPRPADAPPLWAQRGEGCKTSVIEWIKEHHGHLVGDFDEERGRQNRDALAKADPELARAYSSTVRSNKRNLLPGLPLLPRHATADPAEALKRRQETNREAAARYRENKRVSMMR